MAGPPPNEEEQRPKSNGIGERFGARTGARLNRFRGFVEEDLWREDLAELSGGRRRLYRQFRLFYLAVRGFIDNRCLLLASALTFTTLLSLVPLLALMFSILKGLGIQNRLEPILLERLSAGSEEVVAQIIGYIDRTNVKALGAVGLASLLLTAISLVGNIELALNRIWGVQRTRTVRRKFSDYLSVLLTCPILFAAALGLTSSIQSGTFVRRILGLPGVSTLLLFLAILSPYVLMWIALTFVYSYIPNTTVRLRSALFGGVIAGTLWQLVQWGYVHFQIGAARYNAIYGAFAQLPIFLVWLYLGWSIVLFGAVISFTHQNMRVYGKGAGGLAVHYSFREELGLKLLWLVGKNFYEAMEPWTADALSRKLDAPLQLVNEILHQHCRAGFLMAASRENDEVYLLAGPPEKLSLDQVIEAMRSYGGDTIRMKKIEGEETLEKILELAAEKRREALSRLTLKDLLTEQRD